MGLTRDEKCAIAVGEMANLGRFETEFMVYGCAFWEEERVKYRISSKELAMYDFMAAGGNQGLCPTPVQTHLERCLVPSGQKETIALQVKLELAKELKRTYTKEYFQALAPFAKQPPNNSAFDLLSNQCEALEGVFEDEALQWFWGLVELAYAGKVLNQVSYNQFAKWLVKIRSQMEDDVIVKDILEKTFYGFIYQKPTGSVATFLHGHKEAIYRKKAVLEASGALIGGVLEKTYWYDYGTNVRQLQSDFQEKLEKAAKGDYYTLLQKIKSLQTSIDQEAFLAKWKLVQGNGNPKAIETFRQYGYRWHIW